MKLLALCGVVLAIAWWFRPRSEPIVDMGWRDLERVDPV